MQCHAVAGLLPVTQLTNKEAKISNVQINGRSWLICKAANGSLFRSHGQRKVEILGSS
jgi:hypothetical protein